MPRFTPRFIVALIFTLTLWASAYAGIRAGLRAYAPANLAVLRFLIASTVLAIYAAIAHFRRPKLRDLPGLIFTGAVGITFYNIALNYGETRVTAGAASMLIASTPIWTALAARFFLHDRLNASGWLGIFVSFAGVGLIASGEGQGIHLSPQALIILAAAIASATYIILQKHYLASYSALEFTAYSIWAGTLMLLPFAGGLPHAIRTASPAATAAAIYLGIFPGALAYVAWSYILSHGTASRITTALYLTPVIAIGIAWIWLGEIPKPISLIGGAVALCGVVLVSTLGKDKAKAIAASASATDVQALRQTP
jgi:drug/metabolite transporter (DMT)-like permease